MPLLLADIDQENVIKKVGGTDEIKHHLKNLGFISGSVVRIIHKQNGNIIVDMKGTRIALSTDLARKIIV